MISDTVLENGPAYIAANIVRVTLCSSEPANFAGIDAVALGSYTLAPADFSIADHNPSGRAVVCAAQSGDNADVSGAGTHVAYDDGSTLHATSPMDPSPLNTNAGQEFGLGTTTVYAVTDPA